MGGNQSQPFVDIFPQAAVAVEWHPKSHQEVENDLLEILRATARSLARDCNVFPGGDPGIEEILRLVASRRFRECFGYDYTDDHNRCFPPHATAHGRPVWRLCSITMPVGTQVAEYLRDHVFSAMNLPSWMEHNAITDLCNFANFLVSSNTERQWRSSEYTQAYDARVEDQESYTCNSIFVYANGELEEDGVRAGRCVVCYMGVYYPTQSPTKELRNTLQRDAYESAGQQASCYPAPDNDTALKAILDRTGAQKFKDYFQYAPNEIPPESCKADGVDSAMVTRSSHLGYFPALNAGGVGSYVGDQVFGALDIGIGSIKQSAMDKITDHYQNIIQSSSSSRTWTSKFINETYTPADPTLNPVHEHTLIMLWRDVRPAQRTGELVAVTYVYIMTAFYETLPPEQRAIKSLFKILCNNLRVRLKLPEEPKADAAYLKESLLSFAKEKFAESFGFAYAGDLSAPPDTKAAKVRSFAELFHGKVCVGEEGVKEGDVEGWIDNEMFGRDSQLFPAYAIMGIYDDIRNTTLRLCSSLSSKESDYWHLEPTEHVYPDPNSDTKAIKQYGMFVYALGDESVEGTTVRRVFVCYLGVFCGVTRVLS